jgi:hypothetical protein
VIPFKLLYSVVPLVEHRMTKRLGVLVNPKLIYQVFALRKGPRSGLQRFDAKLPLTWAGKKEGWLP